MSINFGQVLLLIVGLFIAKITIENFGDAQANVNVRGQISQEIRIK